MTEEVKVTLSPSIMQLQQLYSSYPDIIAPFAKEAILRAMLLIVGYLKTSGYPPATEANMPGRVRFVSGALFRDGRDRYYPLGYYERGRGAWYPVMRKSSLPAKLGKSQGAIKAKQIPGSPLVAGYKLYKGGTSQRLGQSWATNVEDVGDGSIRGTLGTNTTYANFVQGSRQAKFHADRGWITLEQSIEMARSDIEIAFADAVVRALKIIAAKGSANAASGTPAE